MELNVLNGTHYVYVIIFVHLLFEVKPFSVARSELCCVTVIGFVKLIAMLVLESDKCCFHAFEANNENVKPPLFWRGHQKTLFRCDYFHTKHTMLS